VNRRTPRPIVVLAYSGGLDTSVIVPWLRETYGARVLCFVGDVGQPDDLSGLPEKARRSGAVACEVVDLRESFVRDFVWPTLRAGALYARKYLLGTAMARPLVARRQAEFALSVRADALAHGCTGKGNDQVRFELTYAAFAPDLPVIAPWREWSIASREDALAYAAERGIPVDCSPDKIYSRDANLWHMSHEGGPLEDPDFEPPEDLFLITAAPERAPDTPEYVTIEFERGYPAAVNGEPLGPAEMVERLNALAGAHGVGRADIVEDRLVGMKSRGVYETPGGTLLFTALRELESLVLDRRSLALKDGLAPRYADLVYEGRWWSQEREAMDAMVDALLEPVTGAVRLKLFKGSAIVVGRKSPNALYEPGLSGFGASESFDHSDATGFVRLFGLPTRVAAMRNGAGRATPAGGERPDAVARGRVASDGLELTRAE
jgi:argininosuccinate synthase